MKKVKRKGLFKLMGGICLAALIAIPLTIGCAAPAPAPAPAPAVEYGPPAEVTEWVFQPCFDSSDAGWPLGIVPWIDDVERATQGTVKIELLPVGSITSGDEAFGATAAGMTDIYAGWATVYGGDMPEGMLAFGMALGANNWEEAWAAMWADPKYRIGDIVQAAAHTKNLHWAGWTDQGPNAAFTNFPVNKWEDFTGHKMRAGGPQAVFFEAMGGAPVAMPGGEIYMAIKLGTIEGTFWDTGGTDDMKFYEVVDYAIMPGWCPAQHQEIYINLDSWNALNQWQRDRIDDIFMPNYFLTSRLHDEGVATALATIVDWGGEVIQMSDAEIVRMRAKVIDEVWPGIAALSPGNARGVDIWKQYLRDKGRL